MIADQGTRGVTWVTLATSASTLLCCALPALLVALGAGAVLASRVSVFPQLVWVSEHKIEVFVLAGAPCSRSPDGCNGARNRCHARSIRRCAMLARVGGKYHE